MDCHPTPHKVYRSAPDLRSSYSCYVITDESSLLDFYCIFNWIGSLLHLIEITLLHLIKIRLQANVFLNHMYTKQINFIAFLIKLALL